MLRHWLQFVPNMSADIRQHEALHHHHQRLVVEWYPSEKTVLKINPQWFGKIVINITTKVVLSDHPKIVLKIKQKWSGKIIINTRRKWSWMIILRSSKSDLKRGMVLLSSLLGPLHANVKRMVSERKRSGLKRVMALLSVFAAGPFHAYVKRMASVEREKKWP